MELDVELYEQEGGPDVSENEKIFIQLIGSAGCTPLGRVIWYLPPYGIGAISWV